MSPEIYATLSNIIPVIIVGCGFCCFFLFGVSLLAVILTAIIRTPEVKEQHPWSGLAKANNLKFKPSPFGYLEGGSQIVGTYRGHDLKLEILQSQYTNIGKHTSTCLALFVEDTTDDDLILEDEIGFKGPITAEEISNLIAPNGLPDKLKGSISVHYDGQEIYYEQGGQETDQEYLQTLLDLVCDIADAYPKIVSLGGETVPALRYIATHRNQLQSVAVRLLKSIEWETKERLKSQASHLLCPYCLVRCAAHKVPLRLWQTVTYYGCRSCGQSNEFLDFEGQVVVVLDFKAALEQVEQDGRLRVNWFARNVPFDFDEVEIILATDEDVERFAVKVGNDTDPVRRPRYKQMTCLVSSNCELSENTMRILRQMFGRVEVKEIKRILLTDTSLI